MGMDTYLSIDLDFWTSERLFPDEDGEHVFGEFPSLFLEKVALLKRPVAVAVHHHHILEHINSFPQCSKLVNIDCHSDLCGNIEMNDDVECGTWGNYVEWRTKESSHFSWWHPSSQCSQGKCNTDGGCWCNLLPQENPFFSKNPRKLCGWGKVSRKRMGLFRDADLKGIAAVGICLSPDYLNRPEVLPFRQRLLAFANKHGAEIIGDDEEWDRVVGLYV